MRSVIAESDGRSFPGRAALFLDRDGVVNERIVGGYVVELAELRILEPFVAAFAGISRAWPGPIVLLSNQACIAKGLLDEVGLRSIMRHAVERLRVDGIEVAAWFCCPHAPGDDCPCRKPRAGLFAAAAAQLGVHVERSAFVGDAESDAQAGDAAGCRTFIVGGPETFPAARAFVDAALG